ncbi:hypothetical protein GCM10011416_23400 [Polaribacter pacificus]|uniref:Histidine kinase/HSP90-like ATPase domain-containing protein n=1 Tax=Polaribacter pacificus TaxID=1775173 RepID=A0A917MFQ9_9FLAO|nr:ATP-binding protein [Polaribacter pacificus]GGH03700.1 hypothetical protein GCM10011416_23400 [Polaribacter pacificus]
MGGGFETKKLQNPSNHTNSGFGLFAVKERIQNMNGKFSIVSEINVGTTVNFFVPLS